MFTILGNAISCLFWGVVITILLIVLVFIITKHFHNRVRVSLGKMIAIVLVSFFFLFQTTLFVGGVKAKGYISSVQPALSNIINSQSNAVQQHIPVQDLIAYTETIGQQYPLLQSYVSQVTEIVSTKKQQINSVADFIGVVTQSLHKQVNYYLWRRAGWIAGGLILLLIIMLYEKSSAYNTSGSYSTSAGSGGKMNF